MTVMEAETKAREEVKTRRSLRIVMPGGSGHIGTVLAEALHERGDEVVVVSRTPSLLPWRVAGWEELAAEVDGADAVINLAGRSVDCRYTARHRREILESRVESTRAVGRAIAHARRAPRLWLQMSTATIYAHRYSAPNDERTGILGGYEADAPRAWRFSIDVATAWERAVDEAVLPSTRKVKMRSAIVMSPYQGTPFSILRTLARLGLGGRMGDGRQFVSWISTTATSPAPWPGCSITRRSKAWSTSPRRTRCRTPTSCARSARPAASPSASPRRPGCSRWPRSSTAPRPSCC